MCVISGIYGWDIPSHPTNNKGGFYMLAAILQTLFQLILKLGAIFGLVFMVACTAFVIVCLINGDIKINIVRDSAEKENQAIRKWRNTYCNNHQGGIFLFHNMPPVKGESITMRKATTTRKINEAILNNLLQVKKAEVYDKTSRKTETIDAESFYENFQFLYESGVFIDSIGWHYEHDFKTNGYIIETGRMNPDSEVIITVYLSVCDGVSGEDIERTLEIVEE